MKKLFLIDLSKEFGISESALRFYDEKGLIPTMKRDSYGYRYILENDKEWIDVLCSLKKMGLPIREVKHFIDLISSGDETLPERYYLVVTQQKFVKKRMQELENQMSLLSAKEKYYLELMDKKPKN